MSEAQLRALRIVRDNPGIAPREFAKAMWPDSPAWQHSVKCGPNGSHKGGGMYLAGGAYLAKLANLKLVNRVFDTYQTFYHLSSDGRQALETAAETARLASPDAALTRP